MSKNSFLVAFNKAQKLTYHDLQINEDKTVNCIPIYEELLFTALFIDGARVLTPQNDEQKKLFEIFTQQERYLIASEVFDANLINDKDYRKQNSEFCPRILPVPLTELDIDVFYIQNNFDVFGGVYWATYFRLKHEVFTTFNVIITYLDGTTQTYLGGVDIAPAMFDFSFQSEKQTLSFKFERDGLFSKDYFIPQIEGGGR